MPQLRYTMMTRNSLMRKYEKGAEMILKTLKVGIFFGAGVSSALCSSAFAQDDLLQEGDVPQDKSSVSEPASSEPVTDPAPAPTPAPRAKIKGGKSASKNAKPGQALPSKPSLFFPDWPAPSFDWWANPVLGFKYQNNSAGAYQALTELGLGLGMSGISPEQKNPGASLSPYAGYAIGKVFEKSVASDTRTGTYHRAWGGLRVPIIVKFYKHTLGLSYGQLRGEVIANRKLGGFESDSAVLLLPFWSAHYTFNYTKTTTDSWKEKLSDSMDHWVHTRLFASLFSSYVDIGPGVMVQRTYKDPALETLISGESTSTYMQGLAGAEVFKGFLGVDVQSKYIFTTKTDATFIVSGDRSPLEDLAAAESRLTLPADALYATAFVGLKRVIGNLGLGWRYNLQVINLFEADGKRSTHESQGFGLHYSARL